MICRDLITHMYGFVDKHTSKFCTFVAQRLILKYPFMRDSKGTGYVSWYHRVLCSEPVCIHVNINISSSYKVLGSVNCERVSNVQRKRKKEDDGESKDAHTCIFEMWKMPSLHA